MSKSQAEALLKRAKELAVETADLDTSERCTLLLLTACLVLIKDQRSTQVALARCRGLEIILPICAAAAIAGEML
jgi:hypothetical protein